MRWFTFLCKIIQFDDSETRNERRKGKSVCFRDYFEEINERFYFYVFRQNTLRLAKPFSSTIRTNRLNEHMV